jgi:hypothetical protein
MKKHLLFSFCCFISLSLLVNAQNLNLQFHTLPLKKGTFTLSLESTPRQLIWAWEEQTDTSWAHDTSLTRLITFLKDYTYPNEAKGKPGEVYVTGAHLNGETKQEMSFNNPQAGSAEHKMMELLFTLWYTHFNKAETVDYLEDLEQYFDFGLGIKILKEEPLTYKLYGKVTAYDAPQFRAFLDIIPVDTVVHIDVSNFQSMGRMFYPTLTDFNDTHPKLLWINCNPAAYRHLRNGGVPIERIKFQQATK